MNRKRFFRHLFITLGVLLLVAAGWIVGSMLSPVWSKVLGTGEDEVPAAPTTVWELPDTAFASVDTLSFTVKIYDTLTPGHLGDTSCLYTPTAGVLNFRGTPMRSPAATGTLPKIPTDITIRWTFTTAFDTTITSFGQWGGGTGWTGQPLLVHWPRATLQRFNKLPDSVYLAETSTELIFGSLCGKVYFLDPETGKPVRRALDAGNTVKGTPSVDPALNGMLYVGQGIPRNAAFGFKVFDLRRHNSPQFFSGRDPGSLRGWGAFDSSPVAVGKFLFWPGENGTLYKFLRTDSALVLHSALRYRVKGKNAPGIESSMAVYRNYGFFGDNHGNIICVNLNTMQPVWRFFNLDDTDGTPVIEVENGVPYLYTGCEVDKQGSAGVSRFVKLNALTGEPVWMQKVPCRNVRVNEKSYNGGMLATPLPGTGDCSHLIYSNFSLPNKALNGHLIAFEKATGKVVFRTSLDQYSWSSPVGFTTPQGEFLVFTGDVVGNVYLIRGTDGKILIKKKIGDNFESSPLVVENSVIFGSRGRNMYRLGFE